MVKFTFLKTRQPKQYDYYPRYYDEDKEDLEKRVKLAKAQVERERSESEIEREIKFKKNVSQSWKDTSMRQQVFKTNLRLILILAGVCVLFYYIYGKIDVFLENLMN